MKTVLFNNYSVSARSRSWRSGVSNSHDYCRGNPPDLLQYGSLLMSFLHPFPFLQLTQTLIFFMKLRQQSSAQVANRRAAHLHNSTGGLESNPPSELRETPKLDRDFQKTYHFEKKSKICKKTKPRTQNCMDFSKK